MKPTILFLSIIFSSYISLAQDKFEDKVNQKKITIDVNNIKLEELLNILRKEMNIPIVYGTNQISLDKIISIHSNEISLPVFIDSLCSKAGIIYHFTKGYYILKDKEKEEYLRLEKISLNDTSLVSEPTEKIHFTSQRKYESINKLEKIETALQPIDNTFPSIKKIDYPPISNKKNLYLNFSEIYFNEISLSSFKKGLTVDQTFRSLCNYGIGIRSNILISKKNFGLSSGLSYRIVGLEYSYNFEVIDPQDPLPIPNKTKLISSYLEVPIEVHRLLLIIKGTPTYFSLGVNNVFLLNKSEVTIYNSEERRTSNTFLMEYKSYICALSIGLLGTLPLSNNWNIYIAPQTIFYPRTINPQIINPNSWSMRLNIGLQIN